MSNLNGFAPDEIPFGSDLDFCPECWSYRCSGHIVDPNDPNPDLSQELAERAFYQSIDDREYLKQENLEEPEFEEEQYFTQEFTFIRDSDCRTCKGYGRFWDEFSKSLVSCAWCYGAGSEEKEFSMTHAQYDVQFG